MYPYGQQDQQQPGYPGMPMPGQQQMPYPGQAGGYGMPMPGQQPQGFGMPQQPNQGFGMPQQPNMGYPGQQPQQNMSYPGQQTQQTVPYPGQQPQGFGMPPQPFGAVQQNAYPQLGQMPGMNQQMAPNMGYPGQQQMPPVNQGYGQQYAPQHGYGAPTQMQQQAPVRMDNPTVTPSHNFNAMNDAGVLRKAMKGFGTDEDALISVICRRTNNERQEIAKAFKTSYGKDLINDIKSETKNNFEKLLVACLTPTEQYLCMEINEALAGAGTDEEVLIEVLCTMTNNEISNINFMYQRMYGATLESALMSDSSGAFRRLLVSLCAGGRDESNFTDVAAAKIDAAELLRAGEKRLGTDESTFNRILCSRNFAQLKLVCQEYQNLTGHSLEKAVKGEFSGDIEDGLKAIVRCANSKAEFFAKQLYNSMAGLGTNDSQLIRICVTRCEIDMQDIKAAFQQKYGKTIKSFIKGDSSGDYKHGLYALIGESR